jgi:hypothetical protein
MSEPAGAAAAGAGGGVVGAIAAEPAEPAMSLPAIVADEPAPESALFFLQPAMDRSESAATRAIEVFFIMYLRVTFWVCCRSLAPPESQNNVVNCRNL